MADHRFTVFRILKPRCRSSCIHELEQTIKHFRKGSAEWSFCEQRMKILTSGKPIGPTVDYLYVISKPRIVIKETLLHNYAVESCKEFREVDTSKEHPKKPIPPKPRRIRKTPKPTPKEKVIGESHREDYVLSGRQSGRCPD